MTKTPDHKPVLIEERALSPIEEEAPIDEDTQAPPIDPPRKSIWPSFGALIIGFISFLILLNLEALSQQWLERWSVMGRLLQALLVCVLIVGFGAILREIAALRRIKRNAHLRDHLETCKTVKEAQAALAPLLRSYKSGPNGAQLAWDKFETSRQEALDGADICLAFERDILAPLDHRANDQIERAARRVAAMTTLVPHPAVDILAVTWVNLRMIRNISEIYAGRSGFFSNMRLLRWTAAHFVAAGALELSDEAIGAIVGGSALSKLSRRFGEGAINAALTTRIGLLAQQDCRPAAFRYQEQAGLRSTLSRAVSGLFSKDDHNKNHK